MRWKLLIYLFIGIMFIRSTQSTDFTYDNPVIPRLVAETNGDTYINYTVNATYNNYSYYYINQSTNLSLLNTSGYLGSWNTSFINDTCALSFVPYTGAISNVDLGEHNITLNGTITSNILTGNNTLWVESELNHYSCINLMEAPTLGFRICNDGSGSNRLVFSSMDGGTVIEAFTFDRDSGEITLDGDTDLTGNLVVTDNMTADYYFGDGSYLSGVGNTSFLNDTYVPYVGAISDVDLNNYDMRGLAEIWFTGDASPSLWRLGASLVTDRDFQVAGSNFILNGYSVDDISNDGTFMANSATKLVTEQAIKTYVDALGTNVYSNVYPAIAGNITILNNTISNLGTGNTSGSGTANHFAVFNNTQNLTTATVVQVYIDTDGAIVFKG